MITIDLNADMGESFGAYTIGADEAVMPSITSANVACGYHGGDPGVMRRTVGLARVEDMVLYQIGALAAIAKSEGVRLSHVKAHGALYNMAVTDKALAAAIARAAAAFDPALIFFALPGSELARAANAIGLQVALEGFADRAYEPDGSLTPRSRAGAVIHDVDAVVTRALRMIVDGEVTASDGSNLEMRVDTICTHGDTPGAPSLTRALRAGLERAGVTVAVVASKRR